MVVVVVVEKQKAERVLSKGDDGDRGGVRTQ